jgi:hypothetical protein
MVDDNLEDDDYETDREFDKEFEITDDIDHEAVKSDNISNELLSSIIDAELEDYVTKKKLDQNGAQILSNVLKEHLSCFLILGYDYKGNPTTLLDCKTQKDSDSLNTLLQKYVFSHTTMGNN